MGKKYLDTKQNTLEAAVMKVWQVAAEEMDPVNPKAAAKKFKDRKDKDIDNDGDVDSSDEYLHKRRKAIGKAMKKEGLEDSPNPANSQHLCAKNVVHEEWGEGQPVHGMHAMPDVDGNIAWYDVMFEHGIEKGVSINELKVTVAERHHNHSGKKKNEGAMKRGKDMDTFKPKPQNEEVELDEKVKEYKGVAYFKTSKDAEAHMKKFAPKGRVREYERGYAVQTRIAGPYLNKAGKVEEQVELEKHREFKVQSMRDAMEQVWARSVEDKLFEDINLMSEEQYDEFLDSLNEEELDEIIGRFTAAGQRARAERKLQKTQQKVDDRAAARAAKEKTRELKAAEKQRRRENPGAVRSAAKKVGSGIGSLAKKAKDALMR